MTCSICATGADGKDPLGDLREGKRTLMLIHLLKVAPEELRTEIIEFLGRAEERRTDREISQVLCAMQAFGSIDFAEEFRASMIAAARDEFDEAFSEAADTSHKEFLRSLVGYVVERPR